MLHYHCEIWVIISMWEPISSTTQSVHVGSYWFGIQLWFYILNEAVLEETKKVKLSQCLTDQALSTILDLTTRGRWVVSFVPQLLYSHGKSSWYPLDRRLGGPQSWSGWCGEENILPCWESKSGHPACSPSLHYWAIPTPLEESNKIIFWTRVLSLLFSNLSFRIILAYFFFHYRQFKC
jgi:hypothetical protein